MASSEVSNVSLALKFNRKKQILFAFKKIQVKFFLKKLLLLLLLLISPASVLSKREVARDKDKDAFCVVRIIYCKGSKRSLASESLDSF